LSSLLHLNPIYRKISHTRAFPEKESRASRLNAIQIEMPLAYRQGIMADVNAVRLASCIFDFHEMHSLGKQLP